MKGPLKRHKKSSQYLRILPTKVPKTAKFQKKIFLTNLIFFKDGKDYVYMEVKINSSTLTKDYVLTARITNWKFNHFVAVAVWKHKRREFQPFFSKNKFSACIPRANEIIFEFIMNEMITMADGRIIDIADYLDDLTMKLLMGECHLSDTTNQ